MSRKASTLENDNLPLFVQLDQLEQKENNSLSWKEKNRWIRYEEKAEDVPGRWSKPHVATLLHSSMVELYDLLQNGTFIFDIKLTNIKAMADAIANELLDYLGDLKNAQRFAELLCVAHHHHHDKKFQNHVQINSSTDDFSFPETNDDNKMKHQYSFTDAISFEYNDSVADFKENLKFKRKIHIKSEGSSILVMPVDFVKTPKLVFIRLGTESDLQSMLEVKLRSRFVVLVAGPMEKNYELYEVGRAMATCMADDVCRDLFYAAKSKDDIISAIDQFNKGTMVIPPSEWNPKIRIEPPDKFLSKEERKKEPGLYNYIHNDNLGESDHGDANLIFSKRPFDGLYKDVSRKLKFYASDFADFFNMQCIASTIYMYLVCLCSLVAFGGMLGRKLDNDMGTIECIIAGSVTGVLFSMFSGQPLNIISATGPMLILEGIIKLLCTQNNVDFMEFRLWIGLWIGFFLLIFVAFNLSFLVKYITRFTEDSFASLVAIIFIIDSIKYTYKLKYSDYKTAVQTFNQVNQTFISSNETALYKISDEKQETSFYFSIILFLLTFFICTYLKEFREKPFLSTKMRQFLSDFAVFIAIVSSSALDWYVNLETKKLSVPSSFQPTANREWIVPLFGKNHWYTIFIAIGPAIIATVLIFMDQQITAVIINRKDFKMKKSNGYHLDLFIIALGVIGCSFLGLPWFVAATVLALSHINSLKMMSENTAPGEKPTFVGIREQRGTTLVMSILIGLSVFLTQILSFIPMAVLYGVFLFMGINTLRGMQFIERILILFMPAKHQPDYKYLRYVKTHRVHFFTFIQILGLALLYIIKSIESVAILFPLLVLATSIIRKLLDYVFTQNELFWLDDILPGSEISKSEKKLLKNNDDNKDSSKKSCKNEDQFESERLEMKNLA